LKAILIVCDGLADRPIDELNGRTPLEVAKKPFIDKLAGLGATGIMDTIAPGIPPGSDTAHLALFGYDPHEVYRGRGVFEALGAGLKVESKDIAFRCNFATVDSELRVVDRRAGRISTEEAGELSKSLRNLTSKKHPDVKIIFKHSTEHRGALILRGRGLSRQVSDSDPEGREVKIQRVKALDNSGEARKTAEILNELTEMTYKILNKNPINLRRKQAGKPPANIILFRGAGQMPTVTSISEIYKIKAACVVPNALVRGVAVAAGMTPINVPEATGTVETDTVAKAKAAVNALAKNDLVLIHVKGADNASHDGNLKQKIRMIEKIDEMLEYLLENLDMNETYIFLTPDHATPIKLQNHVGDPVPIVMAGSGIVKDDVNFFSEKTCAKGGLCRLRGINLMPIIMNYLGKIEKFGA
jgi:2,3-bisphosphoglycerate-independent phosphoglycerate mutase